MNNTVKAIRTKRGMSVTELARRTGLSRAAIYEIEKEKSNPLASTIYKISNILDKDPSEVFFNPSVIQE